MTLLGNIAIWTVQAVLFGIGIGVAGLAAHLAGPPVATVLNVHELIPSALIFFAIAAILGWIGNRFWPEGGIDNPLL